MYRLLRDAEHFEAKLGKIDGSADLGTYISNIVKDKVVAVPEPPAPSPPPPTPPVAAERTSMDKPKSNGEVPAPTEAPVS
jgi:hypothetical protein